MLGLQTCAEGDMPALIEKVPGFKKHIREFILQTLASTFQSVKRESIEQSLDLVRDEDVGVRDRVSTVRYFRWPK